MENNVLSEEGKEKYKTLFFTENGYTTLTTYLKNLILEYIKPEKSYPYKLNAVLGIPLFEYALTIHNDSELLGRIKLLGQVLGIKEVSYDTDKHKVTFYFSGKYTIQDL